MGFWVVLLAVGYFSGNSGTGSSTSSSKQEPSPKKVAMENVFILCMLVYDFGVYIYIIESLRCLCARNVLKCLLSRVAQSVYI